ncbi:DNA topoisomerase 3-alpha-like isoform X2 [Montipora capricornis]|uniref:DNA topoisomerase 3-alpha-like isoform X2 n=1 Tax=Montipora capricornis TaxID=246305 RepID=UPI0035F1219F
MRPLRVLNVAEKNDAAKELSRIMSRGQSSRREGFSKFNKIYEFDYNILGQNAKMIMTSLSGHLMSLDFTASHQKWYSCAPVALFSAPVTKYVGENYLPIKRTLEREVRGCQVLIIWTDCDREGENIGFEAINVCQTIRPNIQIYRAKFSEITPQSITRAVQNLVEPDLLQSQAVDVRMELDLRIGAAFTRFQTLRLQKVFPEVLSDNLISYGSCQFPTLGFVVERYKQVQQFVPEPFYKIKVSHEMEDTKVDFTWKRGRLFHRLPCLVLYQICLENPKAKVLSTSSRPKSKWRPLPLDTVELEKLASRKLKINSKETMKIAEKLYNQGFISYPRTETNMFPKSLDLRPLVENQTVDPKWGAFAANVLEQGPNPRRGNKTDNAHPPIHPTKYTDNLQGNDKRLYEFIVRHFLACCSEDAKGQETSVEIEIAGEKFTATGLMIIARNYLDVYPYDKWNAKTIPVYNQGEEFQPSSIEMLDGETKPPPLLTEADLIGLMEKHGIGTDATHAEHIETIKSRCYVGVQQDGTFLPGQLGMGLVEGYDLMGFELSKPRLRAELEADLKRICEGTRNKDDVLVEQVAKYKEQFVQAVQQAVRLDQALSNYFGDPQEFIDEVLGSEDERGTEPLRLCPRCKIEQMILKKTKDGSYMIGCQGYPRCRSSAFFPKFVIEAAVDESLCGNCQPGDVHKVKFKFKKGSVPPMMPLEYTGCVGGCDETLRELLELKDLTRLPSESGTGGSNYSGRGGRNSRVGGRGHQNSSDRGRGRGRGNVSNARGRGSRPPAGRGVTRPVQRGGFTSNQPTRNEERGVIPSNQAWQQNDGGTSSFPSGSGFNQIPVASDLRGNDENCVVCTCAQPATKFTVKKDGPNKGRPFYKCANRDRGCGFFLWADEDAGSVSFSSSSVNDTAPLRPANNFNRNNYSGFNSGRNPSTNVIGGSTNTDSSVPCCHCRQPAASRTVSKEGPNKGRPFYCCSKPRGQGCDFFEWGDTPSGAGTSFKFNAGASTTGKSGAVKRRKCGLCHQEGHTKRSCSMKK